jgi:hypothetical protein
MKKNLLLSLVGIITLLWVGAAWSAPVYYGSTGHWYEAFTFNDADHNWDTARDLALAKGGYLATITSAGENAFVYSLIQEDKFWWYSGNEGDTYAQGPWLGGYQDWQNAATSADAWKWVNGDPWSYTNWASSEPNDYPYSSPPWPPEETGDQNYLHFLNNQYGISLSTIWADTWEDIDITNFGGRTQGYVVEYDTDPVPIPGAVWLLGTGLLYMAGRGRFRKS